MSNPGFKIPTHWWGKLIGGVFGILKGGPFGLLFGIFVGHMVDRFLANLGGVNRTREAFFGAVFSTLGHINKSDGRVTQAEIAAAEQLMRRLQLTDEERKSAIAFFQKGKASGFNLDTTLREFARHSMLRHELRIMLIELLLEAALSDGVISAPEQAILSRVCTVLNIPANIYTAMLRARQGGAGASSGHYQQAGKRVPAMNQSYATLGLDEDASDQQIKRAYRKLVGQYHPDKLVSRGLPDEMMDIAKKRVREINAAYDQIKSSRGIK